MTPRRIVSLVPSLTELVVWLGAGDRLIGRTKFCTEPPELSATVPALGGTKNPEVDRIVALAPDLVIANREENRREDVEALRAAGLAVLLTNPTTVAEAVAMVREIGQLFDAAGRAEVLASETEAALAGERQWKPVRVYVGVWHRPNMGLGAGTYGHSLIEACGGENVLGGKARYPETSVEELRSLAPELILLPDEPFPFDESHARVYGEVAPARVVDGKLLWWYGPRMPAAINTIRAILREPRE